MGLSFRVLVLGLGGLALAAALPQSAEARRDIITPAGRHCYIISSSFHGTTPQKALYQAQRDLDIAVRRVKRREGWRRASVRPYRVRPNPTLRSEVTPDILLKPDVRTSRSYSQCWPGVVWPYVCTSGAKLCAR